MNSLKRLLEDQITELLFQGKAILITGARQVGKTTMLQNIQLTFDRTIWLNADEAIVRERLNKPSLNSLKNIVGQNKTVIIDEVQRIQNAGLLLKLLVDNFKEVQIIATGSSALEISERIFEPMTGRFFLFRLFPFGIKELYAGWSPFEIEQTLPFHLVYGMYPEIVIKKNLAETLLRNLAQQYLYKDVLVWKDIRKPELLDKLLKLLAYRIGSEVSTHQLANTLRVKSETVVRYIDLLEKSFVIFRLRSYSTNPGKELSKMSKIFFWDNGIRNAIIDDYRDLSLRNDQGSLFENYMISERMKITRWLKPGIKSYFWRNKNQSEVDYVEFIHGHLSAYEIKWNALKKNYVTKAFTNQYPNASTEIISPEHFVDFVLL